MTKERTCPDGGKCHHNCAEDESCWRVNNYGPLSAAKYPNDKWPEEVKRDNPPDNSRPRVENVTISGINHTEEGRCSTEAAKATVTLCKDLQEMESILKGHYDDK